MYKPPVYKTLVSQTSIPQALYFKLLYLKLITRSLTKGQRPANSLVNDLRYSDRKKNQLITLLEVNDAIVLHHAPHLHHQIAVPTLWARVLDQTNSVGYNLAVFGKVT